MDRASESHPLQESWTQLLRKEARGAESKRHSWWARRQDPLAVKERHICNEPLDRGEPYYVRTLLH